MITAALPSSVVLDFLRATGEPVRLGDLGAAFLEQHSIAAERLQQPFRVAIECRNSKAGNFYYEYSQDNVTLPDGLSTWLRLEGVVIPMGGIRPSRKGHLTREGTATLVVGGVLYLVTAYLTESKNPFWVKVVAHKKPDSVAALRKARATPRGGRII